LLKQEEISGYVSHLSFDLKAEILGALLAGEKMNYEQLLASPDGQLKRVWSSDLAGITAENLNTGDEMICFHLNRDGLYDTLPEALFHEVSGADCPSGAEMAKESKKVKKEEKEIRLFFQPFENEMFYQGIRLAAKETQLIKSIVKDCITGIIPQFWKIDDTLPDELVSALKKLLPLAHLITGDFELTSQTLQYILKEKVHYHVCASPSCDDVFLPENQTGILGKCFLGEDSIAGDRVNGFIKKVVFTIGPIKRPLIKKEVKSGMMNRFLDTFYGYFIPVELDIETRFDFAGADSLFVLAGEDDAESSHLGYNTTL